MKKFRPSRNGHMASCNDFFWMQDSYFEGFNALIYSLIPDGVNQCILAGCELIIEDEEYMIAEGYVYYEQEIFYVNESSGTFEPGEIPCFVLIESEGPLNPVKNIKGETVSVHFEREMELQFLEEANDFEYDESHKMADLILERLGIDDQDARVADLEDIQADHEDRINQLETDVTNLEMTVTDHNERIVHVEGLEDNIDQLEADVANLEQTLTDQVTNLNSLADNLNNSVDNQGLIFRNFQPSLTNSSLNNKIITVTEELLFTIDYSIFQERFVRRTVVGFLTFEYLREGNSDDIFRCRIFYREEGIPLKDNILLDIELQARSFAQSKTLVFLTTFDDLISVNNDIHFFVSFDHQTTDYFVTSFDSMGRSYVLI